MRTVILPLVVLGLAFAAVPTAAAQDACQSTFTLVGKDDTKWYLGGEGAANPTLTACPGTDVVFTVSTEGAQVHNFAVYSSGTQDPAPGADPATDPFTEDDEPVAYNWATPESGVFTYICPIHGATMSGTVNVASAGGNGDGGNGGGNDSPGFEVVFLGVALVGVALLLRRK